ncbi:MAG TPA: stage III sporulation protein AA, partial [Clostridiales bacterium]|nr:stage III sporulation protein AA [Clostridiales bacterium]
MNNVIMLLSINLRNIVSRNIGLLSSDTVEIRLRVNSPILIKKVKSEIFLEENYKVKKRDIDDTISNLT